MSVDLRVGQRWQEADSRHVRIVRILAIDMNEVTIITESSSYSAIRKYKPTVARRDRFKDGVRTSHNGYFLISED